MRILTGALVALTVAAPGAAMAGPIANGQGWTGFYVGGHVGGVRAEFEGVYDPFNDSPQFFSDLDRWGFSGGGQIGYDVQAPGMGGVVVGVVLDASYTSNNDSQTDFFGDKIEAGVNYIASARVRAGYPVADIMPYATIGGAYADIDATTTVFGSTTQVGDEDWGYVAGIGMDWAIAPSVTVGAEALWYGFDYSKDLGGGDTFELDGMMQVRLTANYRF